MPQSKYTFKKHEKLKGKKEIENLFKNGQGFLSYPFFIKFELTNSNNPICKVLVTASTKKWKTAVKRNRIKRMLRELYRLNKHTLLECLKKNNCSIHLSLAYVKLEMLPFQQLNELFKNALQLLCIKIDGNS